MIGKFLDYLKYERNRSSLTVENYEASLRDFEAYFKHRDSQLSWESVDSDVIRDWMESLMDKGDMASSVNFYLSAVRSFFRFALSRGLVKRDPSHLVKGPKKQNLCRSLFGRVRWIVSLICLRCGSIIIKVRVRVQ